MAQLLAITNPTQSGPVTLNENGVVTVFQQGVGYVLTANQQQMLLGAGCTLQDVPGVGVVIPDEVVTAISVRNTVRALIRALIEQYGLEPNPEIQDEYFNAANSLPNQPL